MDLRRTLPESYRAVAALGRSGSDPTLEPALSELVKMRASQLNGCAYCLDMHSKDARKAGEDEMRLHVLAGWHDAKYLYSEREQAALELTESVTLISETQVPDVVWDAAAAVFTERELAALLVQIITINAWNRIALTTRTVVGEYQAGDPK